MRTLMIPLARLPAAVALACLLASPSAPNSPPPSHGGGLFNSSRNKAEPPKFVDSGLRFGNVFEACFNLGWNMNYVAICCVLSGAIVA